MKKLILLFITASILFTVEPALASNQSNPSDWAKEEVRQAIEAGIVPERLQNNYQKDITREEFAELIVNAVFANSKASYPGTESLQWTKEKLLSRVTLDVEFEDAKQEHVKLAYILGTVKGISDTKFAPNNKITRQEAALMLANTSHIGPINYSPNESMKFSDFKEIDSWALPGVQASWSIGLMQGQGTKFNPKGNISREQAILTAKRLFSRMHTFALKGNLIVYAAYQELTYRVGKNYIIVNFKEDDSDYTRLEEDMYGVWKQDPTMRDKEYPGVERGVATFAFRAVLQPRSLGKPLLEPTAAGKSTKWDYGYMTVSIFDKEGMFKFEYKDLPGFMTQVNGYRYGYPFQDVKVSPLYK